MSRWSNLRRDPFLRDVAIVWGLFAAVGAAVLVMYARRPVGELYHVGRSGPLGGASRALVYSNYPMSLAAIALLGGVVDRLLAAGGEADRRDRIVVPAGAAAFGLCLVTTIPGVVDPDDLDAKAINALPAVGVVLALGLSASALRSGSAEPLSAGGSGGRAEWATIAALVVLALPWIAADLGHYVGDVPGVGKPFLSRERLPPDAPYPAVHLGHHHGLDGVLFAIVALLLGRHVDQVARPWIGLALRWYLALMLVYGLANAANDAWLEQVVRREWTEWEIPNLLRPEPTAWWAGLLGATAIARFAVFGSRGRGGPIQLTR